MEDKIITKASFWGLEVKPGNPTHYNAIGKSIWITQATLGTGNDTERSAVKCRVGKRRPILLCALTPNKVESQRIKMKFQELNDVVFSITGSRSIHLAGYYYEMILDKNLTDSELFGIDIENTEYEYSGDSNDDKYEDSFIDDSELSPGKEKAKEKKRGSGQLNKGKELLQWKDEPNESEDSNGHLFAVFKKIKSNCGSIIKRYR